MASYGHGSVAVTDLILSWDGRTLGVDARGDWRTVAGLDNLVQAIWLRLNTHEGMLSRLGHPDYGSRLRLLIGEPDRPETRERAGLYVARALHREPRIKEIVRVDVEGAAQGHSGYLQISVVIIPTASDRPLRVSFPVYLEEPSLVSP